MSKEFKLSATLYGHSLDVRSVKVTPNNDIISGSRDKTAKFWTPNSLNRSYNESMTYREQKNFVGAVLYLEPVANYPDGLVVTGGYDNTILIYKPTEPFATYTLKEHMGTVSSLSKGIEEGSFLSSSWDTTAKLWSLLNVSKSCVTFCGHNAAVWSAIQLSDGRVVTASADKFIGIWTASGQKINFLAGHTDCVRGLLDFPEFNYFLSVSNDASIKVWNYSGENTNTYYGHTNYIYSIARRKAGSPDSFVTSDEDRTVRVWENGVNVQTFTLPAISVWSVDCLSNGDIVTGSSDGVVRVFTQDESRIAEDEIITRFDEEVKALSLQSTQEIGGVKVSDLPGKEALYEPGKHAGQLKMVRENGGVMAYSWVEDGDKSHWEKVGDVVGGTDKDASGKTVYEGKPYDFVFSVDVEDGKPPLKLPYNKGEDVYQVANQFLTKNMLPASYLEQVVDFILKNSKDSYVPPPSNYVDPYTGSSRYTPQVDGNSGTQAGVNVDPFTGGSSYSTSQGTPSTHSSFQSGGSNLDPFTGGSSYTTVTQKNVQMVESKFFPLTVYRTFDMGNPQIVLNKLKEFNEEAKGHSTFMDERQLERLVDMCDGPSTDPNSVDMLFKLLEWPDDFWFPVLDVVRLAVRHKKNNELIVSANRTSLMDKLKYCISGNCRVTNNIIVALRVLSNLLSHDHGEMLVFQNHMDILENVTSLSQQNKNGQIALSTLLLNLVVLAVKKNDYIGLSVLSEVIPDVSTKLNDPESQFRIYVALGTLLQSEYGSNKEIKTKVNNSEKFIANLKTHSETPGTNELESKRMKCAKQIKDIL